MVQAKMLPIRAGRITTQKVSMASTSSSPNPITMTYMLKLLATAVVNIEMKVSLPIAITPSTNLVRLSVKLSTIAQIPHLVESPHWPRNPH
jgi:hypothetical protein